MRNFDGADELVAILSRLLSSRGSAASSGVVGVRPGGSRRSQECRAGRGVGSIACARPGVRRRTAVATSREHTILTRLCVWAM